jgi:hypothetical protein
VPDDPFRSLYGHPLLPAGFNSAPNAGDEVDGAGLNTQQWPALVDSFEALEVLIITEEMLRFFETDCPDWVAPCENNTVVFPRGIQSVQIRRTG